MNFSPLQRKPTELWLLRGSIQTVRPNRALLCDVVEDSVARLLVLQPLADEDAGRGGVQLAAAQHAVAVAHAVLEGPIVNLSAGIPAVGHTNYHQAEMLTLTSKVKAVSPVGPWTVHFPIFPMALIAVVLVERLIWSQKLPKAGQTHQ